MEAPTNGETTAIVGVGLLWSGGWLCLGHDGFDDLTGCGLYCAITTNGRHM